MIAPLSLQQRLAAVPKVEVQQAIAWLTRHVGDAITVRAGARQQWVIKPAGGDSFVATAESLVDRYRAHMERQAAQQAAQIAQGVG